MSLILEPDEIKAVKDKWCRTWYEGAGFGLEEAIAKAQAQKMAKEILEWVQEHDCRNEENCESALYIFLKSEGVL